MLVCAPSNSAADVIASRLLEKGHIPASNILRMYAASRLWEAVPLAVRCCANYDKASEDYYYPTLAEIMKYHVVIVTLVTSAKLVTSGIPAGHFSHVFIDEGGHAVEPEVLVPIAGILTTEGHRGTFAGQLVIAGDPKQLGPIIRSTVANKMGLGRSFLERLMDEVDLYSRDEETDAYDTAVITKLIKNFRSHKDILNISNSLFYHKELKVLYTFNSVGISDLPPLPLPHSGSMGRSVDPSVCNRSQKPSLRDYRGIDLKLPSGDLMSVS
uniref:DNA2/NAM7 helicase helicase domain-containing protein n=1 Tax=Timema bartmani TaxID=61472 RepID=A0A7R9F7F9_9NEOP|nr:unnamed protein product [Timema bartmani]